MTDANARLLIPAATLLLTACLALADGAERRGGGADKLHDKFTAADTDHDGFLSRAEAAAGMPRAAKHFDEIDANHDGKLSFAEIASYLAQARAARDN